MAQEAIPASSKYWDGKQISITENTQKNIFKKAYLLDAETQLAQYNLDGDAAVDAFRKNGITEEQLLQDPNSYTYIASAALNDLETNANRENRVAAILGLIKLGFTNIYEANTKNFITPPEESGEAAPPQESAVEEPSTYKYTRRQVVEAPASEVVAVSPEPTPQPNPGPRQAVLAGAARFIPRVAATHSAMSNERERIGISRPTPYPTASTKFAPRRLPMSPSPRTVSSSPRTTVPSRPVINRDAVMKMGGKVINTVSNERSKITKPNLPARKFGLSVRRF